MRIPFFSRQAPDLRLWTRRSDVNTVAVGLSAVALGVGFVAVLPAVTGHPYLEHAVEFVGVASGLIGFVLIYLGYLHDVPLVDVEEPWNAKLDQLRHDTAEFVDSVADPVYRQIPGAYPGLPSDWRKCAREIGLPPAKTDRPLGELGPTLSGSDDPRVRGFYFFAAACEGRSDGSRFRRDAVRTYDVFLRSRGTREGFTEWMDEQNVREGAEEILLLLAYMEVARAHRTPTARVPSHAGFWALATDWHPNVLTLPGPDNKRLTGTP